ncbi:MAG: hypothetical protein MAG458_01047 [Nitrosopumilus sp.]|nr:hypothetical protein [Nitrosopumilus sp.]
MAKFKKKKSAPTPESGDSKTESIKDNTPEIPETEKSAPTPEPPKIPIENETEKSEKDKKLSNLFWMRVALAIIAGISATFIFEGIEGEERRWASIGFMIVIFFATIIIAKGMKMQLPSSDRKKIVTQAIGSYVFLYLFSWIVTHTLVHVGSTSSGINL